jgi:hypothetical protein
MSRKPAHTGAEAASGPGPARRDDSAGAEILEIFPLAMYAVGSDGSTGHVSPALQRVLGFPQEPRTGSPRTSPSWSIPTTAIAS